MRAVRNANRSLISLSCVSALLLVHVLIIPGFQPPLSAQSVDPGAVTVHDRRLSDIYFEFAASAHSRGELERADELAETALLFDSHTPDALYIRAEYALGQEQFQRAADYLSRALLYPNWKRYDISGARRMLAAVYYRTDRAKEAYHLMQPSFPSILNEPAQASLYVRVLGKLDFDERAVAALRQAQAGFPAHGELQMLRIRYDRAYAREAIETLLEGDPEQLFGREAFREALMFAFAPEQEMSKQEMSGGLSVRGLGLGEKRQRELLSEYERRWEPDQLSSLYRLLLEARAIGGNDEGENRIEELRAEWNRIASDAAELSGEEFSILRLISRTAGFEMRRMADFSGELRLDTDRDGFVDRRVGYAAGEIEEMSWDMNQDTRPETVIRFSKGSPREVAFHEKEEKTHNESIGTYGRYPNLVSATYVSENEKIDVELVPYELDFDLFAGDDWSPLSPPSLPGGISFPSFDDILPYAAKIERSEGESTQLYSAEEGRSKLYPSSAREKRILGSYSGAELQRRMRDVDGDGIDEITEIYERGKLRIISFDGNGNNKAEYVERYEEDVVLRLWDIDEDGIFDYEMRIENRRADNEVEQE